MLIRRTEITIPNTRTLFSRSAAVLGRPRRTRVSAYLLKRHPIDLPGYCSTGAAEDGRAQTEELSCVERDESVRRGGRCL